ASTLPVRPVLHTRHLGGRRAGAGLRLLVPDWQARPPSRRCYTDTRAHLPSPAPRTAWLPDAGVGARKAARDPPTLTRNRDRVPPPCGHHQELHAPVRYREGHWLGGGG